MNLAQRSISSITWNSVGNVFRVAVLLVRSIFLARLLPVDVFGVYAFASSIVGLTVILAHFGMGDGFLHRDKETENEEQAIATLFTLTLILVAVWTLFLVIGALLFAKDSMLVALLVLTITTGGMQMIQMPKLILIRRVVHRRLVIIQTVNLIIVSLISLVLAWQGLTLWALLSTNVVGLILAVITWYVWQPVWRPRLSWNTDIVRYYFRFGSRNSLAAILSTLLDRVDDLWAGAFLGNTPLGYYSRAYKFATYPRTILARPVNSVTVGTYAELKYDRLRLSRAFFRTNALLIRTGFFLAGLLALVAPEFIRLVLGAKWSPMLDAFRLMLLFTLLDPIKMGVANLFIAVGKPEQIVRARFAQLVVLGIGLFTMGHLWGIAGVALAVDVMLIVGIVILLWQSRQFADFSLQRMFLKPVWALLVGLLLGRGVLLLPGVLGSDWRTGIAKTAVFTIAYGLVLFIFERDELLRMVTFVAESVPGKAGRWLLSVSKR